MRNWLAAAIAAVGLSGAAEARAQAIASLPFEPNSVTIRADVRGYLDGLAPEVAGHGDLRLVAEADPAEAAAAAEFVAMRRAEVIGNLLVGDDIEATLGPSDVYFEGGGDAIGGEGGRKLDEVIRRGLQAKPFLLFIQPSFSAGAAERGRGDAMARALFDRGAISIRADGDDFGSGSVEATEALRAEAATFRRTNTAKIIVVQALETNFAEGQAALNVFALQRAENIRSYLVASGAPSGRVSAESAGASQPDPARDHNRWVHVIVQASGW